MRFRFRQKGAVMLVVLVISMILTTLMSYATVRMNQRLGLADESKRKLQEQAQVYAKLNELTYLIATQRTTAAGVSRGENSVGYTREDGGLWEYPLVGDEIRADGYVYTSSNIRFSVQNQAGLIPINTANQYWLRLWLSAEGYTLAEQTRLTAVLVDYLDGDDRLQPGGREQSEESPGNYLAQRCQDLGRIEEWRAVIERLPEFLEFCSLSRRGEMNLNAVPESLWRALWPKSADAVIAARKQGIWISSTRPVLDFAPGLIAIPAELYNRLGGEAYIARVWGEFYSLTARIEPRRSIHRSYEVYRTNHAIFNRANEGSLEESQPVN